MGRGNGPGDKESPEIKVSGLQEDELKRRGAGVPL